MTPEHDITSHYARDDLLERLRASLVEDGIDPDHPTIEALAHYDHFHGRGLEATTEIADRLEVAPADHLLDIGSGLGGPARFFARRFGCRVTGIDLTEAFCEVARRLTRTLALDDRVDFVHGNALDMPFAAARYDGAYSMNVSMNIKDKDRLYREVARVLKPGAWLVFSELLRGAGAEPDYPTPWARSAETSFLSTLEDTHRALQAAGFELTETRVTREENLAFGARSRAAVERGEKPPHRAVQLVHPEIARVAAANTARGVADGRLIPVELFARKPR
ncbi:MAG: class I SAM-dependent methyltransferase [Betaproteobacteria bacterium]|jgi:ubiquinone/menaquinone biosynthesis C-methylase UbiE|nr:class I SAM-dependent methyltransferase [Betaproteobacteria bacterium]